MLSEHDKTCRKYSPWALYRNSIIALGHNYTAARPGVLWHEVDKTRVDEKMRGRQ